MQVRMKTHISGLRDGKPWPARGETLTVSGPEATDLLNADHAERVEPAKPETATLKK